MKKEASENYLERIPVHNEKYGWSEEDGRVTIEIENKGVWNRIFQKLLKKPEISYIHLDDMGSFIWLQTDGERSIIEIGEAVKERFGDEAEPLYERLSKYFQILNSYSFICFK